MCTVSFIDIKKMQSDTSFLESQRELARLNIKAPQYYYLENENSDKTIVRNVAMRYFNKDKAIYITYDPQRNACCIYFELLMDNPRFVMHHIIPIAPKWYSIHKAVDLMLGILHAFKMGYGAYEANRICLE